MRNGKKISIFAPHPDDELNLFGPFFLGYRQLGYSTEVVFITDGGRFIDPRIRTKEALSVSKRLKYSKTVFLNYPDGASDPKTGLTLYNSPTACISKGFSATTPPKTIRDALLEEIKAYLSNARPDVIIAPAWDSHPDHRMTSALLDEAIRIMLLTSAYRPLFLKSFAYLGCWKGPDDYLDEHPQDTKNMIDSNQVSPFPYLWEERMQFFSPKKIYRSLFWLSPLYRAYALYASQNGQAHFFRCVNTDKCYWLQDTYNIAPFGKVITSSGDGSGINDFKYLDSDRIEAATETSPQKNWIHWTPSREDRSPRITIVFSNPVRFMRLRVHNGYGTQQATCKLIVSGHSQVLSLERCVTESRIDSAPATKISLLFDPKDHSQIMIREIELFSTQDSSDAAFAFLHPFKEKNMIVGVLNF